MDYIRFKNGARAIDQAIKETQGKETPLNKFSDALHRAVSDTNKLQLDADKAITSAQTGSTGNIHEAVIALEKADISFRTMLQVRNKLIEAYQEIMRMQV